MNKKIIISCIIKNEQKNLKKFFKKIKEISNYFKDYFIIIVESDSTDASYELLKKYLINFNGILIKKKTNKYKFRTEKISSCRNEYLKFIYKNNKLNKFDYLLVVDVDNVNRLINGKKIIESIQNSPKNWVGLFPNQFFYYDV